MARRRYYRRKKENWLKLVGVALAGVFAAPFVKPYIDKIMGGN